MRVALAFLKRDFLIATSYKVTFGAMLLSILGTVPFLFFVSRLFGGANAGLLAPYRGNYFAFLLIGLAFTDYLVLSVGTFNTSLRESQLMGTFETILLSPTSIPGLLFYSSLWGYLFTSIRFALYLGGGLLFGLDLGRANIPAAFGILAISILSFAAIGIFIAAVTTVIKKGEILTAIATGVSGILGGVIYPTPVLPSWLQPVSRLIPIRYALEAMRLALIQGYGVSQLWPQFLALAIFAVVLLPLSILSFWLAIRYAKVAGTLGQY